VFCDPHTLGWHSLEWRLQVKALIENGLRGKSRIDTAKRKCRQKWILDSRQIRRVLIPAISIVIVHGPTFQSLPTALSSRMEANDRVACDTRFRCILIAEHLARLLMLLGFVPMHSDSQRFVSIASWATSFTAITRVQIPSGTPIKSIT
jgi:hypothetical protein